MNDLSYEFKSRRRRKTEVFITKRNGKKRNSRYVSVSVWLIVEQKEKR